MTDTNFPPRDLLIGDALHEQLRDENLRLLDRRDELLAAADRAPAFINNDDEAGKVSDFIKQLTALHKAAETARVGAKEPYLEGARGIDGFFKSITEPLGRASYRMGQIVGAYLRDKAERERRQREEAARIAREEEQRKRAEAEAAALNARAIEDAERAAKRAEAEAAKADKRADASNAELSRTRGEYGAVASLRTYWTFRDLDRKTLDLKALRAHLPADCLEKAVRSYIKAGGRELKGVVIFETTDAVVR